MSASSLRPPLGARALARLVRASTAIDRLFQYFDRARSRAVLAAAPDSFYDAYNDLAFAAQRVYMPGAPEFRSVLFPEEEAAIGAHFPPPPARLLIGAAGGGREAFVLAERGYDVVAFEPAVPLAAAMAGAGRDRIEALIGRYEALPVLRTVDDQHAVNLETRPTFDAAILGWTSLSYLRSNARRVEALRATASLTRGPVLVTFFGRTSGAARSRAFSVHVGFYAEFSAAEVSAMADQAGLAVIAVDDRSNWPYAVLAAGE